MKNLPVSVLVLTLNEEKRIGRCLQALSDFDEVIVVDSHSSDRTSALAQQHGARVENFLWNGRYPKKKQWALDHIQTRHEWILLLDADEILTPALVQEMQSLFSSGVILYDGYFITGLNVVEGRVMSHGARNKKLSLMRRGAFSFPTVDDLDLPGMGEVEGHYQPLPVRAQAKIGVLIEPLLHESFVSPGEWRDRHDRYAQWEAAMNRRGAWPADPIWVRQKLKILFRSMPLRPLAAFLHSYILCGGFRDGRDGLMLSLARFDYYKKIRIIERDAGRYWL